MNILEFFKPRKQLPPEALKWNRMWTMWARGEADSPYGELMTYLGEVTNGGHAQYFANTKFLKADMETLDTVLPQPLRDNLRAAYAAYQNQAGEETLRRCDLVFCEHEHLVNEMLRPYADRQ